MKKLSTVALAQYLNVTKRTIQRRAIKEDWPYEEQIGLGGTKRLYDFVALPESVKSKIVTAIIASHENYGAGEVNAGPSGTMLDDEDMTFITSGSDDNGHWLGNHSFSTKIDETELNKDYLRLGLLSMARLYVKNAGIGKIKGFDVFCQLYNDRALEIDSAIYSVIKHVSRISLLRWENNEQVLASNKAGTLGEQHKQLAMDKELRKAAEEILMINPAVSAKNMRQHFKTFFSGKTIPSESYLKQWIEQQKGN